VRQIERNGLRKARAVAQRLGYTAEDLL